MTQRRDSSHRNTAARNEEWGRSLASISLAIRCTGRIRRCNVAFSKTNQASGFLANRVLLSLSVSSFAYRVPRLPDEFIQRDPAALSCSLFFQLDPLLAISNALSSHAIYRGLLWSLVVLIPTMFLGRFFCGWICPLGSVHHYFSSFKSERKRGKQLIESNRYKRWQTTKYYLLIASLAAALMGTGIVGWLDPFSLLVRSLGLSILPATDYSLRAGLGVLEHSRYASVQTVGSILHYILGALLLSFKQPHFRLGIWLGLIFIFIVALNFRITRFWCRALFRWARCWASCRGGPCLAWSRIQSTARIATAACCDAKAATIRSAACRGTRRSAIFV